MLIWLIEKLRGVRISADSDDAHGMVALAGTHEYETPSQEPFCKTAFAAAEERRAAASAEARANAAQAPQEPVQAAQEPEPEPPQHEDFPTDHGA